MSKHAQAWKGITQSHTFTCWWVITWENLPPNIDHLFSEYIVQAHSSLPIWTDLIQLWNIQTRPPLVCWTCEWSQYVYLYNTMWFVFEPPVHASRWHKALNNKILVHQDAKDTNFHFKNRNNGTAFLFQMFFILPFSPIQLTKTFSQIPWNLYHNHIKIITHHEMYLLIYFLFII